MTTLAALANQFLSASNISPTTRKSYRATLTPLVQKHGAIALEKIDKNLIENYLKSLTHLSYTTHHRHQTIIKRFFNYALELGSIDRNPVTGIKKRLPNAERGEHKSDLIIRYLEPIQLKALYQQLKNNFSQPSIFRLHCIVKLLHTSGARISEVLQLDLDEIDFNRRNFQVVGKGNKKRWCFYSEDTGDLLDNYLQYYRHQAAVALFTAQHPKSLKVSRLSYSQVNADWKKLVNSIEILKDARLHDLRHTYATERVGLMGIEELRALMGHENIQTTLSYQKVTSARAEEVAKVALLKLSKNDI